MKILPLVSAGLACICSMQLVRAEEGNFDSRGVKIHYVTAGAGEPIVLIHGWMSDTTMWGRDAAGNTKLDTRGMEGFEIIAMDCRGHGKSDKPHDQGKYGAEMAEDVVRLLDHLHLRKAHLVGYSMGAFIAGKVAARHPDRVLSIVYGGQAPLLPGPKSTEPGEVEIFAKAVADGKGLGPYIIAIYPAKPTREQADDIAKYLYKGKDVEAYAASGLSFGKLEVSTRDLNRCKAPCLFIYGSKEPESLKQRVAYLQTILAASQVKVVDGRDHMTTLLDPQFGTTIVEFLHAHRTGK